MARDRLAQIKGNQSQSSQQPYEQSYPTRQSPSNPQPVSYSPQGLPSGPRTAQYNPPPGSAPSAASYGSYPQPQGSYAQERQPGYGSQQPDSRYAIPAGSPQDAPMDEQSRFFSDISEIRTATSELNENVNRIQNLHQRQLDTVANDPQHDQINGQLQELTNETRQLSNSLKSAIKRLESQTAKLDPRDPNHNVRRSQTGLVKSKFMEAIQRYQTVEQESRKKHRQKMERQFKIVKPDASQDEVNAALDNSGQSNRIFEQALLNSNRYGDARAAFKEVQDRHVEIVKIEQTITELAQMFNDMATMVAEQEPALVNVEAKAVEAETNMNQAEGQMQKAVKSARQARRKRWICFIVLLVILIAVGIGLAVHFTQQNRN